MNGGFSIAGGCMLGGGDPGLDLVLHVLMNTGRWETQTACPSLMTGVRICCNMGL